MSDQIPNEFLDQSLHLLQELHLTSVRVADGFLLPDLDEPVVNGKLLPSLRRLRHHICKDMLNVEHRGDHRPRGIRGQVRTEVHTCSLRVWAIKSMHSFSSARGGRFS